MAFCHKCGYKLDPGDKFCFECGTPVRHSKTEQTVEVKPEAVKENSITECSTSSYVNFVDQKEIYENEDREEPISPPKHRRYNRKVLVIAVAGFSVLLCVGLVIAVSVSLSSKKNGNFANLNSDVKETRESKWYETLLKPTETARPVKRSVETEYNAERGYVLFVTEKEYDSQGHEIKCSYTDTEGRKSYSLYEYDSVGNRIKETGYSSLGKLSSINEFEYDKNGNRTKEVYYYSDKRDKYSVFLYKYDSRGNTIYFANGDETGIKSETTTEYDQYNDVLKRVCGDLVETYVHEFGPNNKPIKTKYTAKNQGKIIKEEISKYEYDSKGRITCVENLGVRRIFEYDSWGNLIHYYDDKTDQEYKYDSKGNVLLDKLKYGSRLDHWYEYEYDETGKLINRTDYNQDHKPESTYKYEYFYD